MGCPPCQCASLHCMIGGLDRIFDANAIMDRCIACAPTKIHVPMIDDGRIFVLMNCSCPPASCRPPRSVLFRSGPVGLPIKGVGCSTSRPRDPKVTLTYGKGAPRPLVPGVLRTPDRVVNLRPKAMLRPRKAAGLLYAKVACTLTALVGGESPTRCRWLKKSISIFLDVRR